MRRIVQYPRNVHYSDVSALISPAWHQWLRHTRPNPPSIAEQRQDVVRQEQLKVLAAQADARWASKKSYLDAPDRPVNTSYLEAPGKEGGQTVPALKVKDPGGYTEDTRPNGSHTGNKVEGSQAEEPGSKMQTPDGKRHPFTRGERTRQITKEKMEDSWKKSGGGPSEEWQPQAWDPNALGARR
jgi:NADH dehydrogenase [ubiquinone] 1 alpha subcomplex assembly factor 2